VLIVVLVATRHFLLDLLHHTLLLVGASGCHRRVRPAGGVRTGRRSGVSCPAWLSLWPPGTFSLIFSFRPFFQRPPMPSSLDDCTKHSIKIR
jgi:hypothetical protein